MSTSFASRLSGFAFLAIFLLTSSLSAQPDLSAEEWREDLRFLQKTVHEDYSFLFKKTTKEAFDQEVETANFHKLPINLYHFNDGVYVEGTHKDYRASVGAKVLAVEGVPIDKVLMAIRPVIPAENDQYAKGYGLSYLNYPEVLHAQGLTDELKKDIVFTLEKDGKEFTTSFSASRDLSIPDQYGFTKQEGDWLSARQQGTAPAYLQELDKHYYFKHLPEEKAVYVRYSQVMPDRSEPIDVFYQRVFDFIEANDVERLILDVRLNGGGNNSNNKAVVTGIIRTEKINQVGKFFVITGRRTFSAAQNLINEFSNYTNAIFVGEPSSENINFYGDSRQLALPNCKLEARMSWAWWQDKPQWKNAKWTTPHLAVDMSFDEYRTNQDPVLMGALGFNTKEFILDPMDHLTELFMAGKMKELQSEAVRMVADPLYRFYDFEGRMNGSGQLLLGQNQLQPAIAIFQFCTQLFPESAVSYDNLGQALLKSGDKAKAVQLFNRALQLDPKGAIGAKAKKRLKALEQN